ncbi:hypothetical protein L3Q82_013707 [Scortum barcoo]|uniref:Uncharacterized protein n=1 Tax=Scortum barcoo TaxID=214431 RepID=A0ACB8W120_9TELE|nr:hypothetical protein L3Q82_013707 [Scortum barcoo]
MDWEALQGSHNENMEEIVDCTTGYINFCMDTVVPKKKAFKDGDTQELKQIQKELRVQLREEKEQYRRKIEHRMQNNNMREVWEGMKTITGCSSKRGAPIEGDVGRANQLNQFFNRFDHPNPFTPLNTAAPTLLPPSHHPRRSQLLRGGFPSCGRHPASFQSPRNPHPGELNDFRPVALTSHVMKTMERLLLHHLRLLTLCTPLTPSKPLLLRDKLTEMGVGSHLVAWITDYLTGRPSISRLGVGDCRSDTVASSTGAQAGNLSSVLHLTQSDTVREHTVFSPVLFTLYTSDFQYKSELCHVQKFCGRHRTDQPSWAVSGVDRRMSTERTDPGLHFVTWCDSNHLLSSTPGRTQSRSSSKGTVWR